ncbi:MAG: SDR family oxidoreductase [Chloroflexota bacterium]
MILITGATGFIGRSLRRSLERQDHPVRAFEGHIHDLQQLSEALVDVDFVYHLAGAESRGRPRQLQHVDVQGTELLIRAARRAGIERLVLMSRIKAEPNSLFPLLRAKGQAERLVQQSGIPYTIIRSATLFGRDDRFLNVIASLAAWTWPLLWLPGGGEVALQPLWVEDVVRCLVQLLDRADLAGKTVTVAGEERMRYRELAQMVTEAAGLSRIPVKVDLRLVRPVRAVTMGWWPRPPVTRFFINRFSIPDVAPFDNVSHTFGFRPERLIDHLAYLRRPGLRRRLFRL